MTDLLPEQAMAPWYGMRSWIEAGFKDTKRGGWQWHQTKITDPKRAERLWLAIAVATLWVVSVGGLVDATLPVSSLEALPETHVARRTATKRARPRMISCFAPGILLIIGTSFEGRAYFWVALCLSFGRMPFLLREKRRAKPRRSNPKVSPPSAPAGSCQSEPSTNTIRTCSNPTQP